MCHHRQAHFRVPNQESPLIGEPAAASTLHTIKQLVFLSQKLKFSVRESQRLSSLIKIRRKSPQKLCGSLRTGKAVVKHDQARLPTRLLPPVSNSEYGRRKPRSPVPHRPHSPVFSYLAFFAAVFSHSSCTELKEFFFPVAFCTFFQIP